MTTNRKTTNETAAQAYASRAEDMHLLIGALQTALAEHAKNAAAEPKHWGFAGDLGEKRLDLVRMIGALTNNEAAIDAANAAEGMTALGLTKYAAR